jgi:hypothetical protein
MQRLDRTVHLVEIAGHHRLDDGMREHAPRAGDPVDGLARRRDLVVGQEEVEGIVDRRTREQRDLGVAVDEDLLHVVREHEAGQVALVREPGVPVRLGELRQAEESFLRVVLAHEVRLAVEDELAGEGPGTGIGDARGRRLRPGHGEVGSKNLVHREERSRHAGV